MPTMSEVPLNKVRILSISPALVMAYKQVRLNALADSPSAFGSTYAHESQFPDSVWIERSTHDPLHRIGFIAFHIETHEPVGLVCCFRHDLDPNRAQVISMWVAPAHRGSGLSGSLLGAVTHWAQSQGFASIQLMVTSNNHRAIAFYERLGFVNTGYIEPYPHDPALHEIEMSRPLLDVAFPYVG